MNILDYYKYICENEETKKIYFSVGEKQKGNIFSFFNTNYRTILEKEGEKYTGFGTGFSIMNKLVGKPYNEWQRYENNENMFKQHTVRMRKSDFFSVKEGVYSRTKKGDVFERMLETKEEELSIDEKKLITYILLLSGHFSNIQNYIFERTKEVYKAYNTSGYTDKEILNIQKEFLLNSANKNKKEILRMDYAYLSGFCLQHKDIDFNKLFKISKEEDKEKLKDFVLYNLEKENRGCILSHKYEGGGNFTPAMLKNTALVLYISKKLIDLNIKNFEDFIMATIEIYSEFYSIKKDLVLKFVYDKKNIGVFSRVYDILYDVKQEKVIFEEDVKCVPDKFNIDTTDEDGAKENEIFSEALKKVVKVNSGYKCIMEKIELCKYFTSKESNQHYLEIHHFIPRAFANDFDESIENKDNYIPLCPNCHRKIHLAVDSERKHLINYIYEQRKEQLIKDGIIPANEKMDNKDFIKVLYDYYKVTEY